MRKKVSTAIVNVGYVKNIQADEFPTKTYIGIGIQGNKNIIVLNQYILSEVEFYGWKTVKEFKGQYLQNDKLFIRYDTFMAVASVLSDNIGIFDKIRNHANNTNDSNQRG